MRLYVRFLVEEAAFLDAPAAARWMRRNSPHWPAWARKAWEPFLREPYSRVLLDLYGDTWLPLTYVWSHRWNAPIYFFRCPCCSRRIRRVIRLNEDDAWACRRCHRAKYASQLQSVHGRGLAHFALVERLAWQWSRPGRRTRAMAQLLRHAERTGIAFEADWARLVRRLA